MKGFLVLIVAVLFSVAAFAQDSLGFANKAEAKNLMVNGLKEGKWVTYILDDTNDFIPSEDTADPFFYYNLHFITSYDSTAKYSFYDLTIYKNGKPLGIEKGFYRSGKLLIEIPWVNGSVNGVRKTYYASGKLKSETPFINSKEHGIGKDYYESGKIQIEYTFENGIALYAKYYDWNGREIKTAKF